MLDSVVNIYVYMVVGGLSLTCERVGTSCVQTAVTDSPELSEEGHHKVVALLYFISRLSV